MRALAAFVMVCLAVSVAGAQVPLRLPLSRTLQALTSPDATTRREAATRLAIIGDDEAVRAALVTALEGEAVPEVRLAVVRSLARRASEAELAPLALAWDRVGGDERRLILAAAEAVGGETGRAVLHAHLGADALGSRACEGLTRTSEGLASLAEAVAASEGRATAMACLVEARASEARDAALLAREVEPVWAGPVLRALVERDDERLRALARAVVERSDASALPAALAWLARHAPAELPAERWRSWAAEPDDRGASALRALLSIAPEIADAALAEARAADGARAVRALDALVVIDRGLALARIVPFVDVPATRTQALDALAAAGAEGARALAALPSAPDVDLALATSRPDGDALSTLRARIAEAPAARALLLASVAGLYAPDACPLAAAPDVAARRRAAACIALAPSDARVEVAARALATEREPGAVAWLALAAHGASVDADALLALLADRSTRAAAVALVPASLDRARPDVRRALAAALSRATRDDDPQVRVAALLAAGEASDRRRRSAIAGALEDPDPTVRLAAAMAAEALGLDPAHDMRARGRLRIEADPRVRAALAGLRPPTARRPLHVRIAREGEGADPSDTRVIVALEDGRVLGLPPIDDELVLFGVPEAPADVRLDVERH